MVYDQERFNDFILEQKVIGFFKEPITLKSGKQSHWYVNWRSVTEDVRATEILAHYILEFVSEIGLMPDCFYGVPEGATKVALLTQYLWAKDYSNVYGVGTHCLPMGRGKPKEHGEAKDRYFLGEPQGKIIVLEDVTTTGDSLLKTIDQLDVMNKSVLCAIGLTNRNEVFEDGRTVEKIFQGREVTYFAMSNAQDLLPRAYQIQKPGEEIWGLVMQEFRYGVGKQPRLV